jgi:hypothetical protein
MKQALTIFAIMFGCWAAGFGLGQRSESKHHKCPTPIPDETKLTFEEGVVFGLKTHMVQTNPEISIPMASNAVMELKFFNQTPGKEILFTVRDLPNTNVDDIVIRMEQRGWSQVSTRNLRPHHSDTNGAMGDWEFRGKR